MTADNELFKFNPWRCKAVGLTEVEARCLNYVRLHTPTEKRIKLDFPKVYEKLERVGLIEDIGGMWHLTEVGKSKLILLLGDE